MQTSGVFLRFGEHRDRRRGRMPPTSQKQSTRFLTTSLLVLLVLLPRASSAQRASLARTDSLIKAGRIEQARAVLEAWHKENSAAERSAANEARATYLKARLATRADPAEDAYLAVALSHATSPYAAESLLRLGQARMA